MQAALIYHARTVAVAAAQDGARAAATDGGTASDGIVVATAFINDAGGDDVLQDVWIDGSRSATVATVTIEGHSLSVVPGWTPEIQQSASMRVEQLTSPTESTNPASAGGGG